MNATPLVDDKKYTRLASRVVVRAIDTEANYDRMVSVVERLMDKGEADLSPEEGALLDTLTILIQAYDDRHHAVPAVPPNEMLADLMESSGRTRADLLPIFGTRGRISEVLSGKRQISKAQAKQLGLTFQVDAAVFL